MHPNVININMNKWKDKGDMTCNMTCGCPKVPAIIPFVPNIQNKTHQVSLPADMVGSVEEMETPGVEDLELPPRANPLVTRFKKSVNVGSMLVHAKGYCEELLSN